jgi:hypothetical protein
VTVRVTERHFGGPAIDPAAETEISKMLHDLGFVVLDSSGAAEPEVRITGEAFSEVGFRRGNLVSCKARVELKAIDVKAGKELTTDRQVAVSVNVSEQIAGKTALQDAAANLADRFIPKLVPASR